MNSNSSSLFSLAHDLLTYGLDGSPIYADQFTRLNRDVYERAIELYNIHGATAEEEAELCLALLVAFAATIYDNGCKQEYIQNVLDRSWEVRLLTYCYGEFYDESLAKEAHEIINTWDETGLSLEQAEIAEELKGFEENQYPWEELEEIGS